MVEIYEKPIITKFVRINGIEFELKKLLGCLYELSEADGALKGYEIISDLDIIDKLVEFGLFNSFIGSRMAQFYSIKDKERVNALIKELEEVL